MEKTIKNQLIFDCENHMKSRNIDFDCVIHESTMKPPKNLYRITEKDVEYLMKQIGKDYIEYCKINNIDLEKKTICIHCDKFFNRTAIKRHTTRFHSTK